MAREWTVNAGDAVRKVAARLGLEAGPDLAEFARGYASLVDQGARVAFLDTVRGVIGPDGQKVSALDRLYLADQIPTLFIWGTEDPIIPVEHGRNAHEIVGHSRLVEIEGSGHWPMLDAPARVADELIDFIDGTRPFRYSAAKVRKRLKRGPR
jgi:pimeloyl-ACP methyl ester carboxylesterase